MRKMNILKRLINLWQRDRGPVPVRALRRFGPVHDIGNDREGHRVNGMRGVFSFYTRP